MITTIPRRLVGRARSTRARVRAVARDLPSPRRTALRVPPERRPPPPSGFAAHSHDSWLVPPTRVHHADRIAVGRGVVILEGSTLWVFDDALVSQGPLVVIGDGVRLGRWNTILAEVGVTIGDAVSSSDGVSIVDTWRLPVDEHRPPSPDRRQASAPVVIGAGAYLGMNCTIGPGVHIGEGAYVGESAVVDDDVPAHTVVYGNPATVTRRYDPDRKEWEGRPWP